MTAVQKRRTLAQILHCHCFTSVVQYASSYFVYSVLEIGNYGLLDLRIIQWKKEKYNSKTIKLECSVPASAKNKIRGTAKSLNRENNVFERVRWNILFYSILACIKSEMFQTRQSWCNGLLAFGPMAIPAIYLWWYLGVCCGINVVILFHTRSRVGKM